MSVALPKLPKSAPIVCVAVVKAGAAEETFPLPWAGRVNPNGSAVVDVGFVAMKAEALRGKLAVAAVRVFVNATLDDFGAVSGFLLFATDGAN